MIPYAQLRSQPRISLADSIPLDAPLTVHVEPTNICNLTCDFCPHSIDDYEERAGYHEHMPIELFSRLMDEIKQMSVKSLKLYFFGEPLMHPQIGQMCRLAVGTNARVELTTNLIPLTQEKATAIIQSKIHYIRVSWYGVKSDHVVRNLHRLVEIRNLLHYEDAPHIAVKCFDVQQLNDAKLALGENPPCDELCIEQLHTIASDFVHLRSYEDNKHACPYPFYTLVVKSNGDVVPCCVAWDESLVVGNVQNSSLAEIWRSPRLEEIRIAHLEGMRASLPACAQCDTIFQCPDSVDSVTADEYRRRR